MEPVLNRLKTFEEFPKLDKVLAVFLEALRLHRAFQPRSRSNATLILIFLASAYLFYREADVDTTLKIPNPIGKEGTRTIPVAKGTRV